MPESNGSGPYSKSAEAYWKRGWHPFPVKGKSEAIPRGVTGKAGKNPGWAEIKEWLERRPFSNVAVRANGWIMIDVDAGGEVSLDKAQEALGQLPDTWTSTSWGPDSPRRHYFFKVPVGFSVRLAEGRFVKRFGPHVDVIHAGHRYAVVAPSKHPDTGNEYRWYLPSGEWAERRCPNRMEDLPELPEAWRDFLQEGGPSPTDTEDDFWDEPEGGGWTEDRARRTIGEMLTRIRTVDSSINTQAGGAMRVIGRFVPAVLSEEEAVLSCRDALLSNPHHSDTWNLSNGKDWNAMTLASMSVSNGMSEPHGIVPEDTASDTGPDPDVSTLYTEAAMAARLASEVLPGQYVYVSGLDWLSWDGQRWAEGPDDRVIEAVRVWALAGYERAVREYFAARRAGAEHEMKDDPHVTGWLAMQGLARMKRVIELARGVPGAYRDAAEFDAAADLLNTPSGVVNLRTGELTAHDPGQLHTKITSARYVPGAHSEALKKALDALPEDVPDWFQLRLGEAVTGHSGDQMVLLTGGGRNGKTVLMGAVWRTLGGYAASVPNTLLLRGKSLGAATPEKMTLRGVRLAYMEETPEEGYLDSQVVKELLDAEVVSGRALYRGYASWSPTHSLFLNTNHPPRVTDTGDGTWRRLVRVDFPYRYRKPGEELEREGDRAGDPGLKAALGRAAEGQEALLAWMVAGAIRFYAAGSPEEAGEAPDSVLRSADRWREESDPVLRFLNERMTFDRNAWVASVDVYGIFSEWLEAAGQKRLSLQEFTRRVDGHSALPKPVTKIRAWREREGLSRPSEYEEWLGKELPQRVHGWHGLKF